MEEIFKTCFKCGSTKLLSEFVKSNRSKDSYAGYCKQCRSDREKELENGAEKLRKTFPAPRNGYKYCGHCEQEKLLEEFTESNRTGSSWCIECTHNYNVEYCAKLRALKPPKYVPPEGYKICNLCKKELPIESFNKDKNYPDGLWCYCKHCDSERAKNFRLEHHDEILQKEKERYWNNKEAYQLAWIENYEKNGEVYRERRKLKYHANKDFFALKHRIWCNTPAGKESKNRRNKKKTYFAENAFSDFTLEQWKEILEKQDYKCAYCGKTEPEIKLTIDHIIPMNPAKRKDYVVPLGYNSASNIQCLCNKCNSKKKNKLDEKGAKKMLQDVLMAVIVKKSIEENGSFVSPEGRIYQ